MGRPRKRRGPAKVTAMPVNGEFELTIGPAGRHCCRRVEVGDRAFQCDDEPISCVSVWDREAAYWAHRYSLVDRRVATSWYGTRPWGWWHYEAGGVCDCEPPCELPDYAGQAAWLARHGVLSAREVARLRADGVGDDRRARARWEAVKAALDEAG